MVKQHAIKTWLLTAMLLLMLLGGGALFAKQHWRTSLAEARNTAERELGLLAALVKVELQNGNFQLADHILKDWGGGQTDVAALRLEAANGIPIGEYRRSTPAGENLVLEAPIKYSYSAEARLILGKDLAEVREHHNGIIVQLAFALAIVAAMLVALTRLQLLHRRESASLKAEMAGREEAQQALRESEMRFRQLFEQVPTVAVQGYAPDGSVRFWNKASETLYGYSRDEVVGHNLLDLIIPPSMRDQVREDMRRMTESGQARPAEELELMRKDGSLVPVFSSHVVLDTAESGRELYCLDVDLSERKRAEAALRRSEERYTLAAQIGRSGAWEIWPAEGRIFFDGNLTRLLGYQAHELSENLADWVDTVPEHARAEVAAAIQAVIEGRADHYTLEHPVRRKDGSIGWVYVQGQRVSRPGETPLRLVGSSLDISERKRAEIEMDRSNTVLNAVNHAQSLFIAKRKAAEIFNGLLDAILQLTESEYGFIGEVRHTEDGRPYIKAHGITNIAWNDETRRFFEESAPAGLDFFKLDNLFGKAVTQRQVIIANDPAKDPRSAGVPEGHPALRSFMGVPFFEGDEVLGVIALANRPDGYAEDLLPVLQPLLTASKNILGSLRVEQQRLAAEAALQQLNEELEGRVEQRTRELITAKVEAERANLAKSEFLSRMSHELRTPMNAILGFSQLLESDPQHPLADIQSDSVQEILHAGRHLLDLINEVLDLARIESGKFTVSQEPVPLLPLISDCLTLIRPQAEARGIRIVGAGRDCGEHVLADRVRLKQVLLNLLSNAVKYNRAQGTLSVVCMRQGDAIQIRISDTGAGLSAEQQARLFVAFERLDADKTAIEGTGIGLALSKRLTELMHGEIGVESTPGSGSTFWVRLPIADARAEDAADAAATASEDQVGRPDSHKQWDILCIEDNPANLRLVERILGRRQNIRLLTAGTPGLGLELAMAHRPALILLDINLPDMDGYDVMNCLRENPTTRDIPVVAVSANAMPQDLARGKAAGFADYLTKPLAVDSLLQVVDAVIATGSSTRPREGAGHE